MKRGCFLFKQIDMDRFFHSNWYISLITLISVVGLYFRAEVLTIIVISLFVVGSWILTRDILPAFLPIVALWLIALRIPREGLVDFRPLYYTPIYIIPGLIAKFIIYPFEFRKGFFFYPTLMVAVAVTLGGLFSISFQDYFDLTNLYYVVGLGFGMVFVYLIFESYMERDAYSAEFFAKMMVGLGIIGTSLLGLAYYERYLEFGYVEIGRFFQLRNNLSNNLLLSMPFAFYLATKKRFTAFYLVVGSLQYMALIFSFSRGGIIFGSLSFPLVVFATMMVSKGQRLKMATILAVLAAGFYFSFEAWVMPLREVFDEVSQRVTVSSDEARANLYRLAWRNFLENPFFGAGLGFDVSEFYRPKTMSMNWYHSDFFQILGGLGLVGVFAYGYQELMRVYVLLKVRTRFNLFVFLSMVGFVGYSLVNIGYFSPFPYVPMVITIYMIAKSNNTYETFAKTSDIDAHDAMDV